MEPEMELVWENRLPRTYGVFVWLLVFSGSVVFAEPALYDLLFIALFLIGVLTSRLSFPKHTVLPAFLLLAFIEANLVSMFFAEADPYLAAKYFLITFYLALSWVFYCGFLNKYKRHALDLLLSGYLTSALFASAIGILAYLRVIPDFGLLIRFSGRLTGFFKDPNTFGSFLVPPVLLALSRMEGETRPARKTAWLGAFALLSAAVFLTFSRAAWGNFAVALATYFALPSGANTARRFQTLLIILMVVVPAALGLLSIPEVRALSVGRLGLQRYDLSRFATYRQAFLLSWSNPLGLGPAQSDIALGMSPHNLYLLVLLECGIVGALTAMWLIAGSVWRSFSAVFSRNGALAPYSAAIAASLLGLLSTRGQLT
ncbi:MAG TPA: hypothetical protein GXX23_06690 [Firmicutes bacterium]|nr:hypothetical protein [Candidatus Fermentithermobacillaceae bacterium]